jgi:hypothetical protein
MCLGAISKPQNYAPEGFETALKPSLIRRFIFCANGHKLASGFALGKKTAADPFRTRTIYFLPLLIMIFNISPACGRTTEIPPWGAAGSFNLF